eukprot:12942820-Alexandrium_andersonii.AAC.1
MALGFGASWREKRPELSEHDFEAAREVLRRKAAGLWLEGTPRTTARFAQHDTVPAGPPAKAPPRNRWAPRTRPVARERGCGPGVPDGLAL